MSRNKNVFTSVDRHLYLASVTYMAGKDKKKFRSHERQKKVQEDTALLFFFLLSIYLVEVPESDSIISLLIRCVTKQPSSPQKIFFKIKFQMPLDSNNNNVISCIGYRHDDNLLQYLNCIANAKKLYLVYSVIECRIHQCQQQNAKLVA